MRRILITGAIGSGKTFLAQAVSRRLKLPIISLDDIFFDFESSSYRKKRDEVDRSARLNQAISGDEWIAEGLAFGDWLAPLLDRITTVCIVDTPLQVRYWQITKRFLKRKLGLQHDPYAKGGFSHLLKVYQWTKSYDAEKHVTQPLSGRAESVSIVHVKSAEDVLKFLSQ